MSVLIAEEGTFISLPSAGRKRMPVPITFPESRSPEWSQTSSTSNCGGFVKWIQATCGRASVRFPNFVLTRNSLLRTVPISESPPRPMITSEAAMAPPVREASSVDETAGPNARHRRIEPYRVKRGVHQRADETTATLAAGARPPRPHAPPPPAPRAPAPGGNPARPPPAPRPRRAHREGEDHTRRLPHERQRDRRRLQSEEQPGSAQRVRRHRRREGARRAPDARGRERARLAGARLQVQAPRLRVAWREQGRDRGDDRAAVARRPGAR